MRWSTIGVSIFFPGWLVAVFLLNNQTGHIKQLEEEQKRVKAKLVERNDACNHDFMRLSNDLNTEQALHKDTQKELATIRSRVVAAELHAQPCPQVCNVDCRDVHFAVEFAAKCAATAGDMLEILGKPGEKP